MRGLFKSLYALLVVATGFCTVYILPVLVNTGTKHASMVTSLAIIFYLGSRLIRKIII